jgi:hypothetical protein
MDLKIHRPVSPELFASIREYLERIIDERDRLYDVRFKAAETAVSAALLAQEKQTSAAFLASEKAIVKAEDAQREYNVRSNEFRGQLDDQAKLLMPRTEASVATRALDDKLGIMKGEFERRLDVIAKEIAGLRESRSEIGGKAAGSHALFGYIVAGVSLFGMILTIAIALFRLGNARP